MDNVTSPLVHESSSAIDRCDTCGHPVSMHDLISTRWCAATTRGVGVRACICSGVVSGARLLTHY